MGFGVGSSVLGMISGSGSQDSIITSLVGGSLVKDFTNISSDLKKQYSPFRYNFSIADVNLQTSTYARIIPEIFGKMRVSGNIIWTSGIKKETTQSSATRTKAGTVQVSTNVSYSVNLAIALCKGEILSLDGAFADSEKINLKSLKFRFYGGDETQLPDSLMQSYLGVENTPAFRGLCYIVIENLSLNTWDGRIPNFSFDLTKKDKIINESDKIRSVCVIPGSGEFVYDTEVSYKMQKIYHNGIHIGYEKGDSVNQNNNEGLADAKYSFDKICEEFKNLEYVSVVSSWFGTGMDVKNCDIIPKVEYRDVKNSPNEYKVAEFLRDDLKIVGLDKNGNVRYGGTPSDLSILRYVDYMKSKGKKVCFYPMLMMDVENKPWRGHLTGSADDVINFFDKKNGYKNYILHYANLLKNSGIDAFIIGSEMVGLTRLKNLQSEYPAVQKLIELAGEVKQILGGNVVVTYAADWSEYHHTDSGFYNMDDLWASENIDVIGIDAYFPLTNSDNSIYNYDEIKHGWTSGEGYDFYYLDSLNRKNPQPLGADWAWKNVNHFWSNEHWNSDGKKTKWVPKMKKIWFTEFGFPSVDCCTNQPNVFFSPGSQDSGLPFLSTGTVDFKAQKSAIYASLEYFQECEFLDRAFLWCLDARPYPFFPNRSDIWSDANSWRYGHFINGKLSYGSISDIIISICKTCGLSDDEFEIQDLDFYVSGIIINSKTTGFGILQMLSEVYNFDICFNYDKITFKYSNQKIVNIGVDDFVLLDNSSDFLINSKSSECTTEKVELLYINDENFRINTVNSGYGNDTYSLKLPIATSDKDAKRIASRILRKITLMNNEFNFSLTENYKFLQGSDILNIQTFNDSSIDLKITELCFNYKNNTVKIRANNTSIEKEKQSILMPDDSSEMEILYSTEIRMFVDNFPWIENASSNEYSFSIGIASDVKQWKDVDIFAKNENNDILYLGKIYSETRNGIVIDVKNNYDNNKLKELQDNDTKLTLLLNDDFAIYNLDENCTMLTNVIKIGNEMLRFQNIEFIGNKICIISNLTRGLFDSDIEHDFTDLNCYFVEDLKKFTISSNFINSKLFIIAKDNYSTIDEGRKAEIPSSNLIKEQSILTYFMFIGLDGVVKIFINSIFNYASYKFWSKKQSSNFYIVEFFDSATQLKIDEIKTTSTEINLSQNLSKSIISKDLFFEISQY